jgi:hypothetical protein
MNHANLLGSTRVTIGGVALLDRKAVQVLFGGNKPLHASTIYRLIGKGIIPPPIHVGSSSRWSLVECEAALARMTAR